MSTEAQEQPKKNYNPAELLAEEPEPIETTEQAPEINSDDFAIDQDNFNNAVNSDDKENEGGEQEPTGEPKEPKENKPPVGKENPPASGGDKDRAFKNLMKPAPTLAMADIMVQRVGAMLTPKLGRKYWALEQEDREDLAIILGETIEEENWEKIPAKYMLMVTAFIIYGAKAKGAFFDKTAYENLPENKEKEKQAEALKRKLKAQEEVAQEVKGYKEIIEHLQKEQKILREQMIAMSNGGKFTPFEEVNDNSNVRNIPTLTPDEIEILSKVDGSMYREFDLDVIEFKDGKLVDTTRAGDKGFSEFGVKMGRTGELEYDLQRVLKVYKKNKRLSKKQAA